MSKVAEAAEDFVQKMTETENVEQESSAEPENESDQKSTMEARKAKMEELRRKMVCAGILRIIASPYKLVLS